MHFVDPELEVQVLDLGWARTRAYTHTHTLRSCLSNPSSQAAQNTKALAPPPKQVGSALASMMALIACLRAFNLAGRVVEAAATCQQQAHSGVGCEGC